MTGTLSGGTIVRTSYFLPMAFSGGVLAVLGLCGMYAASLATVEYADRAASMAPRIEYMRMQGVLTAILGLVVTVWAFDRKRAYARLATAPAETVGRTSADVRSLLFGGLLLILFGAVLLQLRHSAPSWAHTLRRRAGIRSIARIRSVLTREGVVFQSVGLDSKGGRLISVSLEGPRVRDIEPLSGLPIHSLHLRDTAVRDLTPVRSCPISRLVLRGTPTDDLSALAGTQISFLDLRETGITDLRPLMHMPNLRSVKLSRDQILANLHVLRELDITVQIDDGGPAWQTTGAGWRKEFEDQDAKD